MFVTGRGQRDVTTLRLDFPGASGALSSKCSGYVYLSQSGWACTHFRG